MYQVKVNGRLYGKYQTMDEANQIANDLRSVDSEWTVEIGKVNL